MRPRIRLAHVLLVIAATVAAMSLMMLWLPGTDGGMPRPPLHESGAATSPPPSRAPSTQERIHHARPMTPEELLATRQKNAADHARASGVPGAIHARPRPFSVPSASRAPVGNQRGGGGDGDDAVAPVQDGYCMHTVHSPELYADDRGRVCARPDDDGCCIDDVRPTCDGCAMSKHVADTQCCLNYEHCVACCMQALAGGYLACKEACRTSSDALLYDDSREYRDPRHHCFAAERMRSFGSARRILAHYLEWMVPGRQPVRDVPAPHNSSGGGGGGGAGKVFRVVLGMLQNGTAVV